MAKRIRPRTNLSALPADELLGKDEAAMVALARLKGSRGSRVSPKEIDEAIEWARDARANCLLLEMAINQQVNLGPRRGGEWTIGEGDGKQTPD